MESVALKRLIGAAVLVVIGVAGAVWRAHSVAPPPAPYAERPRAIVPAGVRIRLEVVNATRTRGLARRATFLLRDLGFDVVRFTTDSVRRDTTLVLDRSGHPDWAKLASRALGGARIEARPDSARYLDLTVLLGADWRPPAKPFYP
jgi:LytR cell envelope-related transcriptional attenuator